jgi:hypothetical protein
LQDPERIRAGLDRLIEEERADAGRDPERDAEFWSKKITEVERLSQTRRKRPHDG